MVRSLGKIDGVTQENSRNALQMAASAETMSRQAEELRRLVSHFRLGTGETSSYALPNKAFPDTRG
jgi:hypothetical protein